MDMISSRESSSSSSTRFLSFLFAKLSGNISLRINLHEEKEIKNEERTNQEVSFCRHVNT